MLLRSVDFDLPSLDLCLHKRWILGLARRENAEMRVKSTQGPTIRLPMQMEPKEPAIV